MVLLFNFSAYCFKERGFTPCLSSLSSTFLQTLSAADGRFHRDTLLAADNTKFKGFPYLCCLISEIDSI